MTTLLKEKTANTNTHYNLAHYVCTDCDPEGAIAFCGFDVSDQPWVPEEEDVDCIVCVEIDVCPRCDA